MCVCWYLHTHIHTHTHSWFFHSFRSADRRLLWLHVDFWFVNCLSSFVVFLFSLPLSLSFCRVSLFSLLHAVSLLFPFHCIPYCRSFTFCRFPFIFPFFLAHKVATARTTWPALCPPGATVASPKPLSLVRFILHVSSFYPPTPHCAPCLSASQLFGSCALVLASIFVAFVCFGFYSCHIHCQPASLRSLPPSASL